MMPKISKDSAASISHILCIGILLIAFPLTASAQRVAGAGDDAIPVPKGGMRFNIGANWNRYDQLFNSHSTTGAARSPILSRLNTPALGVAHLPQLANAELAIQSLVGDPSFQISLGALNANAEVQENITPLTVEYGVTSRISVAVAVPYVEARTTTRFVLNQNGTGANVGENPAWSTSGTQARSANGLLLRELASAQTQLAAELQRCSSAGEPNCELITGNNSAIQALIQRSALVQQSVATVFGDSVKGGSMVAPIVGSAQHAAVIATIAALRDGFTSFGIDEIGENSTPSAASLVFGSAGFARIAADNSLGLGYSSLGNVRRAGIGDIDVTGTFLLFDSFKADQHARLSPVGSNVRSTITAGWRFGSGNLPRTNDPFDLGTGNGTPAILFKSTTDVVFGARFWISATVKGAKPVADKMALLVPLRDESTMLHPYEVVHVNRSLGLRTAIELAPRVSFNDFFGISGLYRVQNSATDNFSFNDSTGSISQFEMQASSVHNAGIALTYSSLASYARKKSRLPVEVVYTHTRPVTATGGVVPAVVTDRLELRIHTGFPRR